MTINFPTPMPSWVAEAFSHLGLKEVPGKQHNKTITNWLINLKAWWKDDETPWCGTFVAHCLRSAGLTPPKHWYRAKEYSTYGVPCSRQNIPFGAICVKSRKGGGHVFFAVAKSRDGSTIYGCGGNQSNSVNITSFRVSEIDSVRYPVLDAQRSELPVAANSLEVGASAPGSEA